VHRNRTRCKRTNQAFENDSLEHGIQLRNPMEMKTSLNSKYWGRPREATASNGGNSRCAGCLPDQKACLGWNESSGTSLMDCAQNAHSLEQRKPYSKLPSLDTCFSLPRQQRGTNGSETRKTTHETMRSPRERKSDPDKIVRWLTRRTSERAE